MKCGHLFNGIGGFALAAHWMGWENIMHCEIDPFCNKVMNYHFPNSYQHEDIRTTDFTIWRGKLDLITGGFPCQPYSTAGKRKGKEDDRHLWPQMLRAIGEIQPGWIVGENVRGLINWNGGLVFDEVQADLEAEGYEVLPFLLPACALNASHRRDRVWFIAHHNVFGYDSSSRSEGNKILREKPENSEQARYRRTGESFRYVHEWTTAQPKWFTEREFDKNYGFTTEPGICRGDDGFSKRVDRIKALGNAIVPQAVYQIFKAIEQYESQTS